MLPGRQGSGNTGGEQRGASWEREGMLEKAGCAGPVSGDSGDSIAAGDAGWQLPEEGLRGCKGAGGRQGPSPTVIQMPGR